MSTETTPPVPEPEGASPFREDLLSDRVALVTGGGTGIGRAIAVELARHGADLALLGRRREPLDEVAGEVRALGRRALSISADVRDPEAGEAAVGRVEEEMGGLDILVNNAAGNFLARAEELSPRGWGAVVDIVLNGTFHMSRAAFGALGRRGGGAIVNITTTYVDTGAAYMSHSGAAKAGVLNLTRSLAAEWGPAGIRVNAVAPGLVEGTEGARRLVEAAGRLPELRHGAPLGRLTRKRDVAMAVLFLVSAAGAHVSGAHLVVDGGESTGGKLGTPPPPG
jgi:2,4-dienoyl-CoA reductase [(3E)-enoyl-CoA-producing], peroxisomal